MYKRSADIEVTVPALVKLQDLLNEHERLSNSMQRNIQEIDKLKLRINLEMKETVD